MSLGSLVSPTAPSKTIEISADIISEKKADPGIPNSWPYKDKVLAELAAEKRAVS